VTARPGAALAPRPLRQLAQLPVTVLEGVGPRKAEGLASMGIETVADLLTHYPRRYLDRTRQAAIGELTPGESALVLATVRRVQTRRTRQRRALVDVDLSDGTSYLRCVFFNQPWRARQLAVGTEAVLFGKVETYRGRRQMTNPVVDLVGDRTGRIVPVYPQSDKAGLTTWELGTWIAEALRRAGELADPLPPVWRDRLGVVERTWALRQIHEPESMAAMAQARQRLVLDELLRLQVALVARKRTRQAESPGIRHVVDGALLEGFVGRLPFALTAAQRRAMAEIGTDLAGPHPMHRLLQGDVGSGKTLVALGALLVAVQGGHQGALMAPTEVLAEQHHLGIAELVAGLTVADPRRLTGDRPLALGLLTSRTSARERAATLRALEAGELDLLVGTHALIEERVSYAALGVVVIDEQHRFGVEQRARLRDKGPDPDVLVMTATPIPRTAAMTVYGDLDVTVLDELPPGRQPVTTVWARTHDAVADAHARVAAEVGEGRQAYVVCPLVEESARVESRSAVAERERLAAEVWPELTLGLLHGQMPAGEKAAVMAAFRAGEIEVLVATTVVEVGVDVPNATVMVVEDAARFGIAQLHQLRGRVGRGSYPAWCYLLAPEATDDAAARLAALEASTDGFALAEVDLEIRGEGTVLGTRQKGISDLKLASLRRDREWVVRAREVAFEIVDGDPGLGSHELLRDEVALLLDDADAAFLFKS